MSPLNTISSKMKKFGRKKRRKWRYLHEISRIMFNNSLNSNSEPTKPVASIAEKGAAGVGWCSAQKKVKWKLVGF